MDTSSSDRISPGPLPRSLGDTSAPVSGPLGRRGLLGLFAAGAVTAVASGCSEQTVDGPEGNPSTGPASPGAGTSSPSDSTGGTGGESDAGSPPSRDEIVSQYADAHPGEFGLEVSGVRLALPEGCSAAALTFDACDDESGVDEQLLQGLIRQEVPATLFVNRRWAQAHPDTMEMIVDEDLFEVQNHGDEHRPLSVSGAAAYGVAGTASPAEVFDEIMGNQNFLREEYGVECDFFRSGTAHLDETSAQICRDLGLTPVNFTVNLDDGGTLPPEAVAARVGEISSRDIALGHFNQPGSGTHAGLQEALPQLLEQGLRFVTLQQAC